MDIPRLNHAREDQARQQLGHTVVTRRISIALTIIFILIIVIPGLIQTIHESTDPDQPSLISRLAQTPLTATDLKNFETDMENRSVVGQFLLPRLQPLLMMLGSGSEQVIHAGDGRLFFIRDLEHVTGRGFLDPRVMLDRSRAGDRSTQPVQPDSLAAIADFRDQLREHGIDLLIVPTPVKPEIHPDWLTRRIQPDRPPLSNPSLDTWRRQLDRLEIPHLNLHELMHRLKQSADQPLYLDMDTHWTPQTVEAVADELAGWIDLHYFEDLLHASPDRYQQQPATISNRGDLFDMLRLRQRPDTASDPFLPQTVTLRRILPTPPEPPEAPTTGDVEGALPDPLLQPPPASANTVTVRGRIIEIARTPTPGSVPYPDAVIAILLADLTTDADQPAIDLPEQAVIYTLGMRQNRLTAAARWQSGQTIDVLLTPWDQTPQAFRTLNRFELIENEDAVLFLPRFRGQPAGVEDDLDDADRLPDDRDRWSPDPQSPILLIGDSFTNIYAQPAMGWGDSAGLAEQLSFELGLPIDVIAINGGGALASRQALLAELAQNPDRLAHTRLVIWQFATRELSQGDWRILQLPFAPARQPGQ